MDISAIAGLLGGSGEASQVAGALGGGGDMAKKMPAGFGLLSLPKFIDAFKEGYSGQRNDPGMKKAPNPMQGAFQNMIDMIKAKQSPPIAMQKPVLQQAIPSNIVTEKQGNQFAGVAR